jgi:ankyrin repeat protein
LHLAVMYDNAAAAKLLVSREELLINERDQVGETPLHLAVMGNNVEAIKLLLASEFIEVNKENNFGHTPLNLALQRKNSEVAKLLLGHKAIDVNKKGSDDYSALCWAALHNYSEVIKLLLLHKDIDVNQRYPDGNTALYWAIMNNNAEAVKRLLTCENIALNQKNNFCSTQLHIIAKFCSDNLIYDVIAILEEKLKLARVYQLGTVYARFLAGKKSVYSHYDRQVLKMVLAYADLGLTLSNHEGKTFADLLRDRGMQTAAGRIEAIAAKYLDQDDNKNN